MVKGGKRNGAGNKRGSTRPNFFAFVTPKDIKDYMIWVLANYREDKQLALWLGDHLFGKAFQPLTGANFLTSQETGLICLGWPFSQNKSRYSTRRLQLQGCCRARSLLPP